MKRFSGLSFVDKNMLKSNKTNNHKRIAKRKNQHKLFEMLFHHRCYTCSTDDGITF